MQICHVVPYGYPAWGYGGTPRAVWELAHDQVTSGHSVVLLTTTALKEDELCTIHHEIVEGVEIYRLPIISNYLSWRFHFPIPVSLQVNKLLKMKTFDVVHVHEVRSLICVIALKQLKYKIAVLSTWGTLPYNANMVLAKKILDLLFLPTIKKNVNVILAQNMHEMSVVGSFFPHITKIIVPLSVQLKDVPQLLTRTKARNKFQIESKKFVFCFLGRFSPGKGVELLVDAFYEFQKGKNNVELILVGRDDGALSSIKSTIAKYNLENEVKIFPPLYENDRYYAYKAANCFITTPIVYEETATTTLEALAVGTPVVTTLQAEIPFLTIKDGVVQISAKKKSILRAMNAVYSLYKLDKLVLPQKNIVMRYFDSVRVCATVVKQYAKAIETKVI